MADGTTPDPLRIALLTLSDSRDESSDRSGAYLREELGAAGHTVVDKVICADEIWPLRQQLCGFVAQGLDVVISSGSTGVTGRDIAPEAFEPLFDKSLPGFGELFRQLSYDEIGASALQSRATAGLCGRTLVFVLPGSTGACRLALEKIILPQLDARTKPCNFAGLRGRFAE
ncbi:MAG: molybdopterin-binding protein [Myxococcota bacterium]|nr:molybdopterin-binding protein [Myxococcota bacterium]